MHSVFVRQFMHDDMIGSEAHDSRKPTDNGSGEQPAVCTAKGPYPSSRPLQEGEGVQLPLSLGT